MSLTDSVVNASNCQPLMFSFPLNLRHVTMNMKKKAMLSFAESLIHNIKYGKRSIVHNADCEGAALATMIDIESKASPVEMS